MQDKAYESEVRSVFENLNELCLEAQEAHESLMILLPVNEIEKHDIWFKAKMITKNEFIEHINVWLSTPVTCQETSEGVTDVNVNDEVVPEDSVSKGTTAYSRHSSSSSGSSTVSARVQAEAERAALMAHAEALKTKHTIETQQEELRK